MRVNIRKEMQPALRAYLEKRGISYVLHVHKPVFTVEQSRGDENIKKIPGLRTKNLFLKDERNNFYLVCMPGERRLDIKKLKAVLNAGEIHFSSPEELKKELDLTPGSVSIFGMINAKDVFLIIDEEVWQAEITGFHPNVNTQTLEIKKMDLHRFVDSLNCKKLIIKL